MVNRSTKYIGQRPARKPASKLDTLRDTWTVMKPFVHFSYKAVKLLAHTFIYIIKNIPKPDEVKRANQKSDKVIKI